MSRDLHSMHPPVDKLFSPSLLDMFKTLVPDRTGLTYYNIWVWMGFRPWCIWEHFSLKFDTGTNPSNVLALSTKALRDKHISTRGHAIIRLTLVCSSQQKSDNSYYVCLNYC